MKRIIFLILAAAIAISAVSCAAGSNDTDTLPFETGAKETEVETVKKYTEITQRKDLKFLKEQAFRPYFHFSCEINGMNDPNGLYYDEVTGLYHRYYQYDARGLQIAFNCAWGHAVSGDLVHWVELDPAIKTGKYGNVWSGSCVIDEDNSSGFFTDDTDPKQRVVAVFTNYKNNKQVQSVAYSSDGGNTFTYYDGSPVLTEGYRGDADFRDPKVIKFYDDSFEKGYIWVMIIAGGTHQLYTSENLRDWEWNSIIKDINGQPIRSECPDLFPLAVDGDAGKTKWVLSHSGSFYAIGTLGRNKDGKFVYTAETELRRLTTPNTAALQTFFNTADGRRIALAWQADFSAGYDDKFSEKTWNGCHTVPLELKLVTCADGVVRLLAYPVEELDMMHKETLISVKGEVVDGKSDLLDGIRSNHFDLMLSCNVSECDKFSLRFRDGGDEYVLLQYNSKKRSVTVNMRRSSSLALPYEPLYEQPLEPDADGNIKIRVLGDGMALEFFGNDGLITMENIIYPKESSDGFSLESSGKLTLDSLEIYEMSAYFD